MQPPMPEGEASAILGYALGAWRHVGEDKERGDDSAGYQAQRQAYADFCGSVHRSLLISASAIPTFSGS